MLASREDQGERDVSERYASIYRPDLFAGTVSLVTGGGSGLGRCTAHELASLGATVVIAGRRSERLEAVQAEITSAGGRCEPMVLDIRDDEAIDRVIGEIVDRHGRLDHLFNNAGGQFVAHAEEMSPKGWRTVVDLNLNSTFVLSSAAFRHSMQEHGGAIVNMLADISTGFPGMAHMSAARAGIENLAISLTLEWARYDVRVNCVAPGTILSSGMLHYPPDVQRQTVEETRIRPAARLGTESEVSAAVVYLLSPAAAHVRGETISVDGGERFQKPRLYPTGEHDGTAAYHGFPLRPKVAGTPFEALEREED